MREIRGLGFAAEWVIWLSDYTASKALSRAENEAFDILGNPWQKPAQSNRFMKEFAVVKAELGTKRTCPNCATRFYDLLKSPIECPKCATSFMAMSILPSKAEFPGMVPQPQPKPREEVEDADAGEVELISLDEAAAEEKTDDETAGIEDVDLGEDAAETTNDDEDDTFLVEEEDEGNMSDLVEGGGKEEDDET